MRLRIKHLATIIFGITFALSRRTSATRRPGDVKRRVAGGAESNMSTVFQFVLKHGYSILFAALFAHQIGLPLPGPLFLLAAGALAASGKMGLVTSFGLAVIACVLADWVWYEAGRRGGDKVLHFIHRLTRDPDYHDRRAKETFARYGVGASPDRQVRPGTRRGNASPRGNIPHEPGPILRL